VLQQYAAAALQVLFGDLEAVWASADNRVKRRGLLSLPFEALKALLADERTRVASENTVAHTVVRWLAKNKVAASSAQAEELLPLVRVARLTPHYARTVFSESTLARRHLSASERAFASMAPLMGVGASHLNTSCIEPAWVLPARPRSALADVAVLEWSPRLAELEDMVAALAEGDDWPSIDGPKGLCGRAGRCTCR
jgi:hypothetical protein